MPVVFPDHGAQLLKRGQEWFDLHAGAGFDETDHANVTGVFHGQIQNLLVAEDGENVADHSDGFGN